MEIRVDEEIHLSQVHEGDVDTLVKLLNDEEIYRNTLKIPKPYTEHDAREWIVQVEEERIKNGKLLNWAIRNKEGQVLGGIGIHPLPSVTEKVVEVGYWLGKPYRGKGIITKVLERIIQLAFEELGINEIHAHIFQHNKASARVITKAGFSFDKLITGHCIKAGQNLDSDRYVIKKY